MRRRALALLLATAGLAVTATPAGAQAPPGANDFGCRSLLHPVPVILVHGTFGDMTVSWNLFSPALKAQSYCVFALNLPRRATARIDRSANKLAAFVDEVRARTGAAKVSIVGHSQGGMLGRYVARFRGKLAVIDDIVGLAPSSHGTTNPLAPVAIGCPACRQQVAGSRFMRKLNAPPEAPRPPAYTVLSTRYDQVVTPYRSQALSGPTVTNVVLQKRCPGDFTEHVGMVYDPVALQWTLNALGRRGPADPAFVPICGPQVPTTLPFRFPTADRPRLAAGTATVRVFCSSSVGRCVGPLILRDRRGRLGKRSIGSAPGAVTWVTVPVRRAPAGRITARATTMQPGGWVSASLTLRG